MEDKDVIFLNDFLFLFFCQCSAVFRYYSNPSIVFEVRDETSAGRRKKEKEFFAILSDVTL